MMKQNLRCAIRNTVTSSLLLLTLLPSGKAAEVITIGKGSGILWEGLPFNQTLSGSIGERNLNPIYGLASISLSSTRCQLLNTLTTISGYRVYQLIPGVGLIPRSTAHVTYTTSNGVVNTMTGTIGLPETRATTSTGETITDPPTYTWCLPPSMTASTTFYQYQSIRTSTLSGSWVLVADGTQTSREIIIPPVYFGSYASQTPDDRSVIILPSNITLRISTLECSVNTPLTINFGTIARNTQANSELAIRTESLTTSCGQPTDQINANINVQFRPLTGLYQGEPTRLALQQGGGYITGEIDNTTASNGACTATSGIPFDNSPLKIGAITTAQTSITTSNQITWRLCSGGASLPVGAVNASTEMLVTFN